MIDILIPTLGRPERIGRIAENIRETTGVDHRLWFLVEEPDVATIDACRDAEQLWIVNEHEPNYSGAILTGYKHTDQQFLFAGADDLRFHPGWAEAAVALMDDWVAVVGTQDLLNPYVAAGMHATHYLVARWYLDEIGGVVDQGPGSFLNGAYTHQWTDTEFIGTAKARARFRPCLESVVEHLHAYSGKGEAPDATTAKGMVNVTQDAKLYDSRKHLWWDLSR